MYAICFGLTRYHDYIFGKSEITIETDHLPLIGVFKNALNQTRARLQRMLIQVQKYDIKLTYKRGKDLIIADALSRAYLQTEESNETDEFDKIMTAHINLIRTELGASDELLRQIKEEKSKELVMVELIKVVLAGWPNSGNKLKDEVVHGVIYKGQCIVIPRSLRKELLTKLHYNHMGITISIQFAETKVFWPTLRNESKQLIENCPICLKYSNAQRSEPLHPHDIPKIP